MENLEIFLDYIGEDGYVYRYNYDSKKYYNTGISLKGSNGNPGRPGRDGKTPHIGPNGHWFIGDIDTGVRASGGGSSGSQVQSDWNQIDNTADDYIKNKPTNVSDFNNDAGYLTQHQDISGKADKSEMSVTDGTGADSDKTTIQLKSGTSATVLKSHQSLAGKQDALVSGTNIKTINNESILGSGNITIQGGGTSYVPTLNATPTSSTTTYTKDGQTVDFEIGQFARVAVTGGYDFYQLRDLVTENNVTTAVWAKCDELPDNVVLFAPDSGEGIVPTDGIRAEVVNSGSTISVNPDVVTVIDGAVGTAAITLQVPNDNLAHVWDILLTTDSTVAITFAMSNSATILYPDGFSVGASKAVEISVIGVGTKYYLRYGEFA